ncbi:TPA: hypothetical protein H1012_02080 [archaeon]|nr:hypothetical protein [Candidatus Naiadarchaeales archaeon SRR2090153.bin461]HIK02612.1 hypothetical protein [Candidatus Naiadarchaeales archaeon SRR2090159.bin1288]
MKRIALSTLISALVSAPKVFAQIIPTTGIEFSGLFSQAIFMFVLFYGFIMILVGWVYKHTKDRPVEVVPIQPKTLAILGGISGIFVALTPTGLVPPELSTPFYTIVGAMLFIMFIGVVMDIAVFRGKEKESPEEAAYDIVAGAGLRTTSRMARATGRAERMEVEEMDTLRRALLFIEKHPRVRQALELTFDDNAKYQEQLQKKFGRKIKIVDELRNLYKEARYSFAEEQGLTDLAAADILLEEGLAKIKSQDVEGLGEVGNMRVALRKIINAVGEERPKLEKKKGEEVHILEYLIPNIRTMVVEIEKDIVAHKNPKTESAAADLKLKQELRNGLRELESLLRRLMEEIISEAHYLASEGQLVGKMKKVNKQIYKGEVTEERAKQLKAENPYFTPKK